MLIQILVVLLVIGAVLYLLQMLPIDGTILTVIRVVVIVAAIIWLLQFSGMLRGFG